MRKGAAFIAWMIIMQSVTGQATFTGKINNIRNEGIEGALIEVLNTNIIVTTTANGNFNITSLPAGEYDLGIKAINYADVIQHVQIPQTGAVITLLYASNILEDVVVTADKRAVALQQVPLSVSALNERELNNYRIWNTSDLTAIVPTLFSSDPGDGRNVTSLRGITSTSYDQAVATYVDGVNQFNLDMYIGDLNDVERVEILRGPQGTLYGRNAMGGVINIITKKPTFTTSGFVEAGVGNYGLQRYRAGIKTPISKKLLLGAALLYKRFNGYYKNEFDDSFFDKQQSLAGNYYLQYLPVEPLSITFNVKHQQNKNDGAFPLQSLYGEDPYSFHLSQNSTAQMHDNIVNASLAIKYVKPTYILTSETGYQHNYRYYDNNLDGDFSAADAVSVFNNYGKEWNKVKAFTEEIRIASPANAGSKSVQWVAGTYVFYQKSPVKQATVFGKDAALIGSPDSLFRIINTSEAKNKGIAFFGQIDLPVTERFHLIAGMRYDYQRSALQVNSEYSRDDISFSFPVQPDTSGKATYSAISPKAGLQYVLNHHSNLYFNYSRGYRTGGLTPIGSDPSQPALFPFNPEYSNNYEIGFKNTFFKNRVRFNASVFYIRVNNIQVPTLILPEAITVTRNGGSLASKGFEGELSALILKDFTLQYNVGYTDATYTNLKLSVYGTEIDVSGNRQIFTPDVTSSMAVQYNLQHI